MNKSIKVMLLLVLLWFVFYNQSKGENFNQSIFTRQENPDLTNPEERKALIARLEIEIIEDSNDYDKHNLLGMTYLIDAQYPKALKILDRAIKLSMKKGIVNPSIYFFKAVALQQLNRVTEAYGLVKGMQAFLDDSELNKNIFNGVVDGTISFFNCVASKSWNFLQGRKINSEEYLFIPIDKYAYYSVQQDKDCAVFFNDSTMGKELTLVVCVPLSGNTLPSFCIYFDKESDTIIGTKGIPANSENETEVDKSKKLIGWELVTIKTDGNEEVFALIPKTDGEKDDKILSPCIIE